MTHFEIRSNENGMVKFGFTQGYLRGDYSGTFIYNIKRKTLVVVKGSVFKCVISNREYHAAKSCPRALREAALCAVKNYLGL